MPWPERNVDGRRQVIDLFYSAETMIPVWQILLLLLLSTLALLNGRTKLALLINYMFTLYWGYFANQSQIFANMDNPDQFISIYFGIGVVIAVLAAVGFLFQKP